MKLTNAYFVLDTDGNGHPDDLFNDAKGSLQFASPNDIISKVNDHNIQNPTAPFIGSFIISNVITYSK